MPFLTDLNLKGYSNSVARWARFGPYYAMFPLDFAFEIVEKYSNKGDYIIDPFAGRCSSIYAGGVLGRYSLGIEINPVGWLYGKVKLNPAPKEPVIDRLLDIYSIRTPNKNEIDKLPDFFNFCFCKEVLSFLIIVRNNLQWKTNNIDATLMSIILVYLHGKLGEGLSNQMRQTKSMGPKYSINWWKQNDLTTPPEIDPYKFLLKKIEWRYKKGLPELTDSRVIYGDSSVELDEIVNKAKENDIKFSLLFTSPPYLSITNYYVDQWLRLWLLGGEDRPKSTGEKHKDRFNSKETYYKLLDSVFSSCSEIMSYKSVVYVRTDARNYTFDITYEILKKCFSKHKFLIIPRPFTKRTQTGLFGDKSKKPGEIDIILTK